MARPSKWQSPTCALRVPEKYAAFLEEVARNLEELESFVQNPSPPFSAGDKVMIRFDYPDDYRLVEVLEVMPVRPGVAKFYFAHPDTEEKISWYWSIGSDVVLVRDGESRESAIRRSIVQKSFDLLTRPELQLSREALGLDFLTRSPDQKCA